MKPYWDKILTAVLTPASWLYGTGVWVRNKIYDAGLIKEHEFDIPVISVGNLTVGGTGKTPHVEYIASRLADRYRIAVLSRGYKRKTKGFVLANANSSPDQIGDEPMQIYKRLGDRIKVAVCEDRKTGIRNLRQAYPDINMIILDDAFQHRKVKAKLSVLLIDYNRPLDSDNLLPLGRLREPGHAKYRADMLVVTKCPDLMNPIDYRMVSTELDLLSFQKLYFSSYEYGSIKPVFPDDAPYSLHLSHLYEEDSVLLLTGIAYPRMFVKYFKRYPFNVRILRFPDHHQFSRRDIRHINRYFENMEGRRKIILTTEKDAVRIAYNPYFPQELKPYIFYLPIEVVMRHGIDGDDLIYDIESAVGSKNTN